MAYLYSILPDVGSKIIHRSFQFLNCQKRYIIINFYLQSTFTDNLTGNPSRTTSIIITTLLKFQNTTKLSLHYTISLTKLKEEIKGTYTKFLDHSIQDLPMTKILSLSSLISQKYFSYLVKELRGGGR